jgi:hypothetical protein
MSGLCDASDGAATCLLVVACVPCAVSLRGCRAAAHFRVYLVVMMMSFGVTAVRRSALIARHWPRVRAITRLWFLSVLHAFRRIFASTCLHALNSRHCGLVAAHFCGSANALCLRVVLCREARPRRHVRSRRARDAAGLRHVTVNFPAGEKLTAGSWKAAFSEIGRAEPYMYGAALCVIAGRRWHVCAWAPWGEGALAGVGRRACVCVQLRVSRATCSRTRR